MSFTVIWRVISLDTESFFPVGSLIIVIPHVPAVFIFSDSIENKSGEIGQRFRYFKEHMICLRQRFASFVQIQTPHSRKDFEQMRKSRVTSVSESPETDLNVTCGCNSGGPAVCLAPSHGLLN